MPRGRALVLLPGEGRRLSLGSAAELCFKADDAESEGAYAVSVATVGPDHPGTTPHLHREHDDLSFVLEGRLAFEVGHETFEAPAGTFVLIPRGLDTAGGTPLLNPRHF